MPIICDAEELVAGHYDTHTEWMLMHIIFSTRLFSVTTLDHQPPVVDFAIVEERKPPF